MPAILKSQVQLAVDQCTWRSAANGDLGQLLAPAKRQAATGHHVARSADAQPLRSRSPPGHFVQRVVVIDDAAVGLVAHGAVGKVDAAEASRARDDSDPMIARAAAHYGG